MTGLDYGGVPLMQQGGSQRDPMSSIERIIPVYVAGMEGRERCRWLCYDLTTGGSGASPGWKRQLIRGGGGGGGVSRPDQ